ncbi:MAG: type II secretion system protein [Phycisphaerae bacterium]|jgi:prepilin-type N-terminal cleavage/methylation domain-containing protein
MRAAFTLVEMLVVIAIIGLLVGILLPVFGTVRNKARVAQTSSEQAAIDTGLSVFINDFGALPPSASDNPENRRLIANPEGQSVSDTVEITGAQLLVHALIGADSLGTPGFRDFGTGDGIDGAWWNDTHAGTDDQQDGPHGAYYIDPQTGQEAHSRRTGYVPENMNELLKSFTELEDESVLLNLDRENVHKNLAVDQRAFVDAWSTPLLYYRANPASFLMVTDPAGQNPGVFWHDDNAVITGTQRYPGNEDGFDFGPGMIEGHYHDLHLDNAAVPLATTDVDDILQTDDYEDSFARFIVDPKVKVRPTPVRKDSYLLISAGPDARYGTEDDVTNWPRGQR